MADASILKWKLGVGSCGGMQNTFFCNAHEIGIYLKEPSCIGCLAIEKKGFSVKVFFLPKKVYYRYYKEYSSI